MMLFDSPPPYQARAMLDTITIAVFGPTGAGKSTFINVASGANFSVSGSLESCTDSVVQTEGFRVGERTVRLVDTPGFDDTERSDVEVLKLISSFLESQYEGGTKLNGVLYMHRISDNRMGGASTRSFRLFKKLCGDASLKNVVIVTTMWDQVTMKEGEGRENDLIKDRRFYEPALADGAKIMRHSSTVASAHNIISSIFDNHPMSLTIQTETVDEKKRLIQTTAGQELESDLISLHKKHAQDMEAIRDEMRSMIEGDARTRNELGEEIAKSRLELARIQNELSNLRNMATAQTVDVKRIWKGMKAEERALSMFMRSHGVQDTPEWSQFWAALGDTGTMVAKFGLIFDKYPFSLERLDVLFDNSPESSQTAAASRIAARQWVDNYPKEFRKMEEVMGSATRKAHRRQFWLWLFGNVLA